MIKEFEVVALTEAIPAEGLEAGDTGTIVEIYDNGKGFDVEFVTALGETIAVVTLHAHQVRPLSGSDMSHVRQLVS